MRRGEIGVSRVEQQRRAGRGRARRRSPAAAPGVSRKPDESRGRALFSAMRAVMRSTSETRAQRLVHVLRPDRLQARDRLVARAPALARSRSGWCSQWRSSAAAHAGGAVVEQREERRRGLAAQRLGDLEVAPRGGIQAHVFAGALGGDRVTCASAWPCVLPA